MNIGCIMCGILCVLFVFFAVLFHILKENGAMLISGFNTMPKEKRKLYDKARMSLDQRNAFAIWAALLGAGAVLSCYISQYLGILVFAVWLVLFLKEVHFDVQKAFEKYRIL